MFALSDRPAAAAALSRARTTRVAAMSFLSTSSGHISRFGLRMANFILSRIRSLYQGQLPFYQSRWQLYLWPFYQQNALSRLRTRSVAARAVSSIRNGNWPVGPISCCPAQAVYRPGRAFLARAGKASCRFITANRNGRFIKASLFETIFLAPRKASSKFSSKAPRKAFYSSFASCAAP